MFKTRRIPTTRAAPLIGGPRSAALSSLPLEFTHVGCELSRRSYHMLPGTIWYMYDGLMLS